MNLHQLRFVGEAVRQNFNLTEPSRAVLKSVQIIMQETDSLKRIGNKFAAHDSGSFTIATTHTQARYSLPTVVQTFTQKFPKVRLSLLHGNPKQVAEMVLMDQADLAIATESIANIDGLISRPCYQWEHQVVVPPGHPLLKSRSITLGELAEYPLITYDSAFTGCNKIGHAFSLRNIKPDILLEAIDTDVIKTYVKLGIGVGIIASMVFDPEGDRNLRAIPAGQLFGSNVSRLALKQCCLPARLRLHLHRIAHADAKPQAGRTAAERRKDMYEL